jgi:hypothetical protein
MALVALLHEILCNVQELELLIAAFCHSMTLPDLSYALIISHPLSKIKYNKISRLLSAVQ